LFLFVPKSTPANISIARKIIETCIPKTGRVTPEISINPSAEPARSALYIDEGAELLISEAVNSLKICPVIKPGKSDKNIIKVIETAGRFNDKIFLKNIAATA
jgi:hypothetical protein